MSSRDARTTFKVNVRAWARGRSDFIFSLARLLSTLWFASAVLLGLLLFLPATSRFRPGVFLVSAILLLGAGAAFSVVHLLRRGSHPSGAPEPERQS